MTSPEQMAWEQAADESDFATAKQLETAREADGSTINIQHLERLIALKDAGVDVREEATILLRKFHEWQSLRGYFRGNPLSDDDARRELTFREQLEDLASGI